MELEDKRIAFIKKYSYHALSILLLVALALFSVERFWHSQRSLSHKDYAQIPSLFAPTKQGLPLSVENITAAETILKRHPELVFTYGLPLSQAHFLQHQTKEGLELTQTLLSRTRKHLPKLYQLFSQASIEITLENYQEAYRLSEEIEMACKTDSHSPFLRALNLLRLCSLGEKLHLPAPWKQIQQLESYSKIAGVFREGDASLDAYLSQRANLTSGAAQ